MPDARSQAAWTKAISPDRDRLQSRVIVWIAIPALVYPAGQAAWELLRAGHHAHGDLAKASTISVFFALAAWRLKAATALASAFGGVICFLLIESFQRVLMTTMHSLRPGLSIGHSGLGPLVLLFILTFGATRLGRERKAEAGLAESRKGRRAAQIIANLGIAAFMASVWGNDLYEMIVGGRTIFGKADVFIPFTAIWMLPTLSALAEATADTVSSEIGQAFGGTPRMLLTLRPVPPGTDGAVTLLGTLAGTASAALIAATGIPALGMSFAECLIAFAAGVAGLFFDSLLGATLERRGWLGNDLVNLSSTAFAAALALLGIRLIANT